MIPITKNRHLFQIPVHWTGDQAKTIFEMLHHLAEAIFDVYETEITLRIQNDIDNLHNYRAIDNPDDNTDDDIPF